ncbi:MAG: hypothetical protein LC672_06180 [Acidobacteria bacterium]|nr:hypothetical protein [Acidobacteriota bacterium]
MSGPIAFVSHFRIKEGRLDALTQLFGEVLQRLEAEKPRTTAQLAYLNDSRTEVSIVHVFADAATMDLHAEGANERAEAAYEFMEPAGWEIYGTPSEGALQMMRQAAATAGVPLKVDSEYLGGFLRLQSA